MATTSMTASVMRSPSFVFWPAQGPASVGAWIALPDRMQPGADPFVVVHGIKRSARSAAEGFAEQALAQGRPVIAPEFTEACWPLYQQVVRQGRADLALLGLMQGCRAAGIWQSARFDLCGYSGGAQFAHRFAMLYPHLIGHLTLISAGWYTFPDMAPFPYGLGQQRRGRRAKGPSEREKPCWGPRLAAGIGAFLDLPIDVAVGGRDVVADAHLRRGVRLDRQQGITRLQRARSWVAALGAVAADLRRPPPRIRLTIVEAADHDLNACLDGGTLAALAVGPGPGASPGQGAGPGLGPGQGAASGIASVRRRQQATATLGAAGIVRPGTAPMAVVPE
ncbi:MAG: hypothetical protein AAF899_06325 [Pseudomonadota bacterium]